MSGRQCKWCKRVFDGQEVISRNQRALICMECSRLLYRGGDGIPKTIVEREAHLAEMQRSEDAQNKWRQMAIAEKDRARATASSAGMKRKREGGVWGEKTLGIFYTPKQLKDAIQEKKEEGDPASKPPRKSFIWNGVKGFLVSEKWNGCPENCEKIIARTGDLAEMHYGLADGCELSKDEAMDMFDRLQDTMRVSSRHKSSGPGKPHLLQLRFHSAEGPGSGDGDDGIDTMLQDFWKGGLLSNVVRTSASRTDGCEVVAAAPSAKRVKKTPVPADVPEDQDVEIVVANSTESNSEQTDSQSSDAGIFLKQPGEKHGKWANFS